jgi:enterochelin esterase-like enzyme
VSLKRRTITHAGRITLSATVDYDEETGEVTPLTGHLVYQLRDAEGQEVTTDAADIYEISATPQRNTLTNWLAAFRTRVNDEAK